MPPKRLELPQGTLDLLILKALALEPLHGWSITERLRQLTKEALWIQQGSLYPSLYRMERRGWIEGRWATSENNRRVRYYELTPAGRRQLHLEESAWQKLTEVIGLVLAAEHS